MDVIVSGQLIVELKAVSEIAGIHFAQALSYLKASGLHLALIVNFGEPSLTWRRVIRSAKSAAQTFNR